MLVKDNNVEDQKIIDEINRKYEGQADGPDSGQRRKKINCFVRILALVLVLVFLFTVTGRWLTVFSGPTLDFLRESWELSSDPLVSELKESVVQVYIETKSGSSGGQLRGSGFNLDPDGLVVTNRHLVEDAAMIRVSFPGKGSYIAREWILSPHRDLALVLLEAEEMPAVVLSDQPLLIGEELILIGNPLQFTRIANKGVLIGYQYTGNRDLPLLVLSANIYPGNSGSPVFNSNGEVAGVVFAFVQSEDPSERVGLAVSVEELKLFLAEEGFQ